MARASTEQFDPLMYVGWDCTELKENTMARPAVLENVPEDEICETVEDFVHEYDRVIVERTSPTQFRVSGS